MSNDLQSEQINELAAALVEFQYTLTGAYKDSTNPFHRSKYADLETCINALREPLHANGLAVSQTSRVIDGAPVLVTTLMHKSGQWLKGELPLSAKRSKDKEEKEGQVGPQEQGSAITYARRYALCAITGLYQTDDDGEAAQQRPKSGNASTPSQKTSQQPASTTTATRTNTPVTNATTSSTQSSTVAAQTKSPSKPIEGEEPFSPGSPEALTLATKAQMDELSALASKHEWKPEDVAAWILKQFKIQPPDLRQKYTYAQWVATCKWVAAHKPGEA